MTLARRKAAYLEAMGIGVWEPRHRPSTAAIDDTDGATQQPPAILDCLQAAASPLASVILQWPGRLHLGAGHPGGALLLKILSALGQPLERFSIYQLRQDLGTFPQIPDEPGRAVFQFVDRPAPARPGHALIGLPTLERMLAEPLAKRTAWERLRPWVRQLGSPNISG